MNCDPTQDLEAAQGEAAAAPLPEESPAPPEGRPPSRFNPFVTALCLVLLVGSLALLLWDYGSTPALTRAKEPERALHLMVGRILDLDEALTRVPIWERILYEMAVGGDSDDLKEALIWYDELAEFSDEPLVQLQLAILEAEAGRPEQVRARAEQWTEQPDPYPLYAHLLRAAYLESRLDPETERALQGYAAELIPAGWFYDRLALELAGRGGDRSLLLSTRAAMEARTEPLVWRVRALMAGQFAILLIGIAGAVLLVRRRGDTAWIRVGRATVPPSWRGWDGVAVLARGGLLGMVMIIGLSLMGEEGPLLHVVTIPLSALPLLLLARRHLLVPTGAGFREGLGLRIIPGRWPVFVASATAVTAAGLLGEWVMSLGAQWLDLSSHWTEWFDADLAWGPRPIAAAALLEYIVLAPLFEETVFRGLLFATLRRQFQWAPAALLSATVFSLMHGYGVLGFVNVVWSGLLWAWAYEKTGSLLPGMAAHMVNNVMVTTSLLIFLRF
jgi:hypothetical protein